jgi:MobA/MobL family
LRFEAVAIYHLHVKAFSRSSGRSATASAAYRAGEKIIDQRTKEVHDYSKKRGIEETALVIPGGVREDRSEFWNRVELHHKRGDAVVAREIEVSLPAELTRDQRRELAVGFAKELSERYGVAADIALHEPSRRGDQRNHHAHIMLSACRVNPDGTLGKKAVELDPIHCQRHQLEPVVSRERARWAELANAALERHRHPSRLDHRTLKAQGIERVPTQHRGPSSTAIERQTKEPSRITEDQRQYQTTPQEHQEMERARELAEVAAFMRAEGLRLRQEMAQERQRQQLAQQERQRVEAERALEQARAQMRAEAAQIKEQQAQERVAELSRQREQELARERERQRVEAEKERQRNERNRDRGGPER